MKVIIDPGVQSVLEFMQERLPMCRLVAIAESLPQMARLLWGHCPQESCNALALEVPKSLSRPRAIESGPEQSCVDGGFAAVADDR